MFIRVFEFNSCYFVNNIEKCDLSYVHTTEYQRYIYGTYKAFKSYEHVKGALYPVEIGLLQRFSVPIDRYVIFNRYYFDLKTA